MATHPVQVALPIVLSAAERATLERWARGRRIPRRVVRRARIVLQAAAGLSNAAIARALRTDRECVGRWRARFAAERLPGLQHEAARSGRPPGIPDAVLPVFPFPTQRGPGPCCRFPRNSLTLQGSLRKMPSRGGAVR